MVAVLLLLSLPTAALALVCGPVSPASHIDPETRCNYQGSVETPRQLGATIPLTNPKTDRAHAICRNYCLDNQYCLSYSYSVKSGACNQYSSKVVDMGPRPGSTGTFYWNRYCWAQNYSTVASIQNSGFELAGRPGQVLQPWVRQSDSGNYLPVQSGPGSNDSAHAALLRVGTRIGVFNASISQAFAVCPNTTYYIQPLYRFLGRTNTSRSSLSFDVVDSAASFDSFCLSGDEQSFNPGQASSEWSSLIPAYNASTFLQLDVGPGAASIGLNIGVRYGNTPNQVGTPMPDPLLDQYLIDMNVFTAPNPNEIPSGVQCSEYTAQRLPKNAVPS